MSPPSLKKSHELTLVNVVTLIKVVAGGLGAAKGAISNWWGGLRQGGGGDKKTPSPPTLSPVHKPTTPKKEKSPENSPVEN